MNRFPKWGALILLTLWVVAEFFQFMDSNNGNPVPQDPLVKYLESFKNPQRQALKIKHIEKKVKPVDIPKPRKPAALKKDQKLFGMVDFPAENRDEFNFNVAMGSLKDLEENHKYGIQTLLNLNQDKKLFTDTKGCFSLSKWKTSFKPNETMKIKKYITKGTIIGINVLSNPEKWENKECSPTYSNANSMCDFIANTFGNTKCGFQLNSVWAARGKKTLNKDKVHFIITNYHPKKGNPYTWINTALKNLSWYKGDIWLSANIKNDVSAENLKKLGMAICIKPIKGLVFNGWDKDIVDKLNQVDVKKSMEEVSNTCIGFKGDEKFTRVPASVQVREKKFNYLVGDKANMYIDVHPGTETQLKAEWYHGTNPEPIKTIYLNPKNKNYVDPYSFLVLDNVQANQLGNYTLKVSGEYGQSQGTIYLDIKQ